MPRLQTLEGETAREYAWRVYPNEAMEIRSDAQAPGVRCRRPLCHALIWWGTTRARGKPFDIKSDGTRTGTSHRRTCFDPMERAGETIRRGPGSDVRESGFDRRIVLAPRILVARHKHGGAMDAPETIGEPAVTARLHPRRERKAMAYERFVGAMLELHGDRDNPRTLWPCARTAVAKRANRLPLSRASAIGVWEPRHFSSVSTMFSQLPCSGVSWIPQLVCHAPRLERIERFVPRPCAFGCSGCPSPARSAQRLGSARPSDA